VDTAYLCIFINSDAGQRYFEQNQIGGGQKNVNAGSLKYLPIALPSTKAEQEAIAHGLSDADALIESLEQLLAKKRHLKQGAMQELLTGKKRLPGFSGKWFVKSLGDVLSIAHGRSQHGVAVPDGIYPILATGGQIGTSNRFLFDKPSVLIGRKGTIDRPQYMDQPFWTVDTLFYTVVHEPNCAKFLFYRFCLIPWKQHNEASGVPSLNARTIEQIEIAMPPDSEEQIAIAAVLSDMDAEIATLETKLTKVRQLKTGMMQELLTGRIRLVEWDR
jgi:type I restriction enzyme S subunit